MSFQTAISNSVFPFFSLLAINIFRSSSPPVLCGTVSFESCSMLGHGVDKQHTNASSNLCLLPTSSCVGAMESSEERL